MRFDPYVWAKNYGATMSDARSLRHMRDIAQKTIERDDAIRQAIVDRNGEEAAVAEWDNAGMLTDKIQSLEAIAIIDKRLLELGLEP